MYIELPKNVEYILEKLMKSGFEAFVVGGCVRDSLLNKIPEDWDVTTNAKPQDVKDIFERTIATEEKYGTIVVVIENETYEVTSYRIDGDYTDNRRPDDIKFTSSLSDDLRRRDFSINAMAYNPYIGLVDLYHGKEDLDNKIIRCVGDPIDRFSEDYLRIIRCYRFAITYNFEIEELTYQACKNLIDKKCLVKLPTERIQKELNKIFKSDINYNCFKLFMEIFEFIMLQIVNCLTCNNMKDISIFDVFNSIDKQDRLAWVLYNYTSSIDCCDEILIKLKYSNKMREYIYGTLFVFIEDITCITSLKRAINKFGFDITKHGMYLKYYNNNYSDTDIKNLIKQLKVIKNENQVVDRSQLAINGNDIKEHFKNINPIKIGKILDNCLMSVIDNNIANEKDKLLDYCSFLINEKII